MTHTCAPDSSPKLKSLQDLSIRIKVEVTEETVDHISL
jgi:predicted metalloenzyme YecM